VTRPFEELLRSEIRQAQETGDAFAAIPVHLAVHVADLVVAVRRSEPLCARATACGRLLRAQLDALDEAMVGCGSTDEGSGG
jgi:hypothetical protein